MNNSPEMNPEVKIPPPQPAPGFIPRVPSPPIASYYQEDPRKKVTILAMILSLMPGLGQIYVGFYQQGFVNIVVVTSIITLLSFGVPHYLEPTLGLFLAFFWLFNIVDAGRRSAFYNQVLAGISQAELPEDFMAGKGMRSLAGGVALILVGLVCLSHTKFGVPMDWLEYWWPMGLVIMGGYLLYQSLKEKKKSTK